MLSPDQQEWLAQFTRIEQRLVTAMRTRLLSRSQHLDWLSARLVHPRHRLTLLQQHLQTLTQRLHLAQSAKLHYARAQWQKVSARLQQQSPRSRLQALTLGQQHLSMRLVMGMRRQLERQDSRLRQTMQSLHTLSPLATLERGYAIVQRPASGALVVDAKSVKPGERVHTRLAQGYLDCVVEKIREN